MTEKPRETQAESHVVELKEKVNNSSLMKHRSVDTHGPDTATAPSISGKSSLDRHHQPSVLMSVRHLPNH